MKTVLRELRTTVILFSLLVAFLLCAGEAFAQTQGQSIPNRPVSQAPVNGEGEVPLTSMEEELHAKRAIKLAEKQHHENLDRAREIGQIGKDLRDSLKYKTSIERECL